MTPPPFTVEEANGLLPTVGELLERLREAHRGMDARQDAVMASVPGNGGGVAGREFLEASAEAADASAALESLGVVVRDPESGLVDFPAVRDGLDVFLCWKLGEDAVEWWHPLDTGFAGRRPLADG